MVFGARLIQESRNWRIKNPEFAENMDNFIKRCVIREAMIGKNYTPQDLLTTNDIWSLAKRHASRLRQVPLRYGNSRSLETCAKAARKIEVGFTEEIASLGTKYQKSDFVFAGGSSGGGWQSMLASSSAPASTSGSDLEAKSDADNQSRQNSGAGVSGVFDFLSSLSSNVGSGRLNKTLSANIAKAFGQQIGGGRTAESIIKQQMMINAMYNFSDDYGFARASSAQESSWRLSGDLSTVYLPMLLTVTKGICYASFIFLIPLLLLSGGMSKYLGYLSFVASLQLWPALNSILNMFIDLYSSHSLSDIAGSIVSFSTASKIGDYTDKIVAVASGLQMAVYLLAFKIVQGGVSGFMDIAGTITGAMGSAATSAAHEVTTGNRSLDNISTGNLQKSMQSGFKTDLNSSFASSASSYQHADGTMERTLLDGETIYSSGAGITTSSGATNVETRTIASSQTSDTLSDLQSKAQSSHVAYTDSETATMSKALNSLVQISKHDEAGTAISTDKNSSESRITQHAQSYMRHMRDTFGYSHDQAAAAYLKGSLDLELFNTKGDGKGDSGLLQKAAKASMSSALGKLLPFNVQLGGGISGSFTASNNDSQSLTDETASSIDNSHIVAYSSLETALSSEHYAQNNSKDQSLADDLRASREHTNQLAHTAEMRSEDLSSYGSNITNSNSTEVIVTKESRDEMVGRISEGANIHPLEAHRALERGDKIAARALKVKASEAKHETIGAMQSAKQFFAVDEREEEVSQFKEEHQGKINVSDDSNQGQVRQNAAQAGVTEEITNKAISDVKARAEAKANSLNKKADNELKIKEKAIQMEHGRHKEKIRAKEADRWTSKAVGRKNDHN